MTTLPGLFCLAFVVGFGLTMGVFAAGVVFYYTKELFDYLTAPKLKENNEEAKEKDAENKINN